MTQGVFLAAGLGLVFPICECGDYRIIYRAEDKKIAILMVRHGKQMLPVEEIAT